MRGFGSQSSANRVIRSQVVQSFWLRRRNVRRQRLATWKRKAVSVGPFALIAEHSVVLLGYRTTGSGPNQADPKGRPRPVHPDTGDYKNVGTFASHNVK